MHKLLSSLLLLCSWSLFSQTKIDSLKMELKTIGGDSLYIQRSIDLGNRYMRVDLDSALAYFSIAEGRAKKSGAKVLWATAKYRKGNVHRRKDELYLAKAEYDTALPIFIEFNNSRGLVGIKTELASLAVKQQRTKEAVELYLEALDYAREIQDKNEEARIYNYLGVIYQRQKQNRKAINAFERALSMVRELNFNPGISACLTNLASAHTALGESR